MLTTPMDVVTSFPVRKIQLRKQAFRNAVCSYAAELGYECKEEKGRYGSQNLVIGNPEKAKYLVTAHYDTGIRPLQDNTSGVVTLLEIIRTLPENQRQKACFVLFDLGAYWKIGSGSYRKSHPETENQLVLNLNRVGDGDEICIFPTKMLKNDRRKLTSLYKACGYFGKKSLLVQEERKNPHASDCMFFSYGADICAMRKEKKGRSLPKTSSLDETNINILRAALTTYICCGAAQ